MSEQPRKKQARKAAMVEEAMPAGMPGDELVGDHRGYLAIGLAAAVVAIVGVIVVMIVLAAT